MRLFSLQVGLLLGAASILVPSSSEATCPDAELEAPLTPNVSLASSTLSAPVPHQTLGSTVVAAGSRLYIRSLETHADVGFASIGSTIQSTPNPVELEDGSIYTFIVRQDGRLQKFDAVGNSEWLLDLRRNVNDSLSATPAIHLRRYASVSFQAKFSTDLVYVATRYGGAGGSTANRVYAVNADTGSIVWIFNNSGTVDMDVTYEAPFLDYASDRLIVGTDRTGGQDSLWSIDVLTAKKAWSTNVGQLYTAPFVRDSRIYVATLFGDIKALSTADGATLWSVGTGSPILTNFFPEFRLPYNGLIAYVDYYGNLGLLRDDVTSGSLVWKTSLVDPNDATSTPDATSRVVIDSDHGKAYVGASDGQLYQLSLVDGSIEATREVDPGAAVGDAGLVIEGSDVSMVVGSSGGQLAKFCGPWTSEASIPFAPSIAPNMSFGPPNPGPCNDDSDCGAEDPTPCSTWQCVNTVCVPTPINEGGVCDGDGNSNTGPDICRSGTCIGESECQRRPDRCKCRDEAGITITRSLLSRQATCPPPPGGLNVDEWCGHEVSETTSQNACLAHGARSPTVVWVKLIDKERRPFKLDWTNGSEIVMHVCDPQQDSTCPASSGSPPVFLDPDSVESGGPYEEIGPSALLSEGMVRASDRAGTYFAYLGPQQSGEEGIPSLPWVIRADVQMNSGAENCIDTRENLVRLDAEVHMRRLAAEPCPLDSNRDQTGYLKVRADVPDGTSIRVGDGPSNNLRFAETFAQHISGLLGNNPPTGESRKLTVDGTVEFIDFGNYLNAGRIQDNPTFVPTYIYVDCPSGEFRVPATSSHVAVNCP